jgi:hypothetical protein
MSHDTSKLNHRTPSQWAQITGEIVDKPSGTTMSTTISFDHLVIDIPRAKGTDGNDMGSAN